MNNNIIESISPFIVVFLASYIGLKVYYKQKEYELVRQRYLNQCLDLLCQNVDDILSVFRSNWAQSLWILQLFRDAGKNLGSEYYEKKFIKLDYKLFTLTPFFRLKYLINDQIFWNATQDLIAFIETTNSFFENDLLTMIKLFIEKDSINLDSKILFEEYVKKIDEFEKQSHKYYDIIYGLLTLSSLLEKENFSFKKIQDFKNKKEVLKLVENLKTTFSDSLKV